MERRDRGISSRRDKSDTSRPTPQGRPPTLLRGTHNRPWQRETSSARSNDDVVADDDYYDFSAMDVVMAPTPTPAPVPPLPPSKTSSTVSAYDRYRQKSKMTGSTLASLTSSGETSSSAAAVAAASRRTNSIATTSSPTPSPLSNLASGTDSKLSSYERYRQQRQKQQQQQRQEQEQQSEKSNTDTTNNNNTSAGALGRKSSRQVNLTGGSSTTLPASRSTARSPPKMRQVFMYDSSEIVNMQSKPPSSSSATSSSIRLYGKSSAQQDDLAGDSSHRSSSTGRRGHNEDTKSERSSAASLTGGANELQAALAALQKKKGISSEKSSGNQFGNSSSNSPTASPYTGSSVRDLRKSRLSTVAGADNSKQTTAIAPPPLDSSPSTNDASYTPSTTIKSLRKTGVPVIPRARSPASLPNRQSLSSTEERSLSQISRNGQFRSSSSVKTAPDSAVSDAASSPRTSRAVSNISGSNTALPPTGRRNRSPSPHFVPNSPLTKTALSDTTKAPTPSPTQTTRTDMNSSTTTRAGWDGTSSHRAASVSVLGSNSATAATTLLSQNSKVGKYLATRNAQRLGDATPKNTTTVDTMEKELSTSQPVAVSPLTLLTPFTSDDDTNDDDNMSVISSDDDGFDASDKGDGWSVRVCIVSAVDFPINVVPNLPLSPVLRVALVPMPDDAIASNETLSDKDRLQRMIDASGVSSIKKARIRCTSSKVTSKRDNGSVEFHEELRWDYIQNPHRTALAIELSARAVMTPANIRERPYAQSVPPIQFPSSTGSIGRASRMNRVDAKGGIGSLFGRNRKTASEMETANAAAVVAKHLVEEGQNGDHDDDDAVTNTSDTPSYPGAALRSASGNQSEMDVKLRRRKNRKKIKMTDDIRLGSQVIPLTDLPLKKSMEGAETARIEQWFQLETSHSLSSSSPDPTGKTPTKRNPSILLEISFSSRQALDDSEDDMDEIAEKPGIELKASFSRRASMKIRSQLKKENKPAETLPKQEEPLLEPGIIDYICVVGALDIGNQKSDDGSSGWVNTTPECGLLEQFPPNSDYLAKCGRNIALPDKVEWFCFPEGCRLWRGTTPPNSEELNLKRFSASSPTNIATTIASFDACLACTTSLSWFVLASNSDEYGSENVKTYGVCIRFYVPAPIGIDQTQDDFAQFGGASTNNSSSVVQKRLWVPMGICVTSSMPIIGTLEIVLLRMCEALSSPGKALGSESQPPLEKIYEDILNLAFIFHKPIPGLVQCSVPFLTGEPLKVTLSPRAGLPPLPHGSSVTSVCRLLGADGIVFLLSAMLTESKIVLHSNDAANLSLVAEVGACLIYPFSWSLPYIPVLPFAMMEFIEAPMPYLVGIPSCNLKMVDPLVLEDIVVIDLDKDVADGEYFEDLQGGTKSKIPTALPSSSASNISKAVYRLLQADTGFDLSNQVPDVNGRTFPRMQDETIIEREFRIAVAMEVCGLVRGYQDCLVYASSSQPMFNVDKFLQSAPILFEEQRGMTKAAPPRQILSPRSRRFMSIFVNCQHFHQFLESEQQLGKRFFHEIMRELDAFGAKKDILAVKRVLSLDAQKTIDLLRSSLQRLEDRTATFTAKCIEGIKLDFSSTIRALSWNIFPVDLLNPIEISSGSGAGDIDGVKHISLEYLVELEKNPWKYNQVLSVEGLIIEECLSAAEKVKITDAIGERRYRNWLNANEKPGGDDASVFSDDLSGGTAAVDLGSLLAYNSDETSVTTDTSISDEPASDAQRRIADAKDRDILRRCLERANVSNPSGKTNKSDSLNDLVAGAEMALRNPSARRFLLSVLGKLSQAQKDALQDGGKGRRRTSVSGSSKLESAAFETLVRLGCAMLDASMEDRDYNSAYSLLKLSAGLYCTSADSENAAVIFMTQKMGHHPIYADLGVWERAKDIHLNANRKDPSKQSSDDEEEGGDEEYEAAVATLYEMLGYGIPAEELARFASRVSENSGWFRSERGQSLLLLARRICMRRDQGESTSTSKTSDLEMMNPSGSKNGVPDSSKESIRIAADESDESGWIEFGWVHPAAQSSRRMAPDRTKRVGSGSIPSAADLQRARSESSTYMKRSAITTMAFLNSSVIASGGLDGGVFLARRVKSSAAEIKSDVGDDPCDVRGVHLDWGSSGSRYAVGSSAASLDGEYGVGAVSCLAATRAANQSYQSMMLSQDASQKDTTDSMDDEDILDTMEGARIVAGTTCGDLRVWSVKDVLSAVFYANQGGDILTAHDTRNLRGEGTSSTFLSKRRGAADFAAGSSLTRLKFSLRGRALSGHRGGVSCIDVPSHIYRPDSIISGGADGLIKLWSLRTSGSGRRNEIDQGSMLAAASKGSTESMASRAKSSRSGDALSILSGHGGRVLCIKTAWHGDRLLSGGADRTVRVWDLAGSGGKCLHSLSGHFGWVTSVQYWGPNTIISASTDRSIALWDARVRNTPLFALRHHNAPISSVLVGTRTDPIMMSAASDGTIAAWDFRHLSDAESGSGKLCKIVRSAAAKLYLHDFASRRKVCGPVHLSRGPNADKRTVLCVGRDSVIREWDIRTGDVVSEHVTGHCDTISTFSTFQGEALVDTQLETTGSEGTAGTISTSWDGTIRMRTHAGRK